MIGIYTEAKRRVVLLSAIFAVALLSFPVSTAWSWSGSQRDAVCQGGCGGGCGPCPGSGNGGGVIRTGPSPQEIAWQNAQALHQQGLQEEQQGDYESAMNHLLQARSLHPDLYNIDLDISVLQAKIDERALRKVAREMNEQGVAAYRNKDYALAAEYFQQALDKDPGDYVIQKNLKDAKSMAKAYRDAAGVHASVTDTLDSISNSPQQKPAKQQAPGKAGLRMMTASGTNFFGSTKSDPSPSELGPTKPLPQSTVHSTLDALSSVEQSSWQAARDGGEGAIKIAGCGFDNVPCAEPVAIAVPRPPVQTPAAMDVLSHLPDSPAVRNDPAIRKALAKYESLEKSKARDARKLAAIQKEIAGGKPETAKVKKQVAAIEKHLHQQSADQEKAVKQIKKRVINLGATWNEAAQP